MWDGVATLTIGSYQEDPGSLDDILNRQYDVSERR